MQGACVNLGLDLCVHAQVLVVHQNAVCVAFAAGVSLNQVYVWHVADAGGIVLYVVEDLLPLVSVWCFHAL